MKNYKRMILVGQLMFIMTTGFAIDKIIQHNTKSNHREIVPYTSVMQTRNSTSNIAYANDNFFYPKKAEEVWADQDSKFLQAEDRYSNSELALMMLHGNKEQVERTIEIDKYDKQAVNKEFVRIEKLEKENLKKLNQYKETMLAKSGPVRENTGGVEVIKALPHKTFKSYMPWTVLAANTPQGRLSAKAIKDTETAIMTYEGRYLVALGFAYSNQIGEKIDVVMEDGRIIPVIVGDWKATKDTINNSTHKVDGSIIEFIVNSNKEAALDIGTSGNYDKLFPGKIKEFRKGV